VTSARKVQANRTNARASTGPKTAAGRVRSAQNARRHGLSLSAVSDPALSPDIKALGQTIAGAGADCELIECAHRIAAAQIDIARVRLARHEAIARALSNPEYQSSAAIKLSAILAKRVEKYSSLLRPETVRQFRISHPIPKPTGPNKLATILSELSAKLLAMDRYERRALSRRKFAIREFDRVRR